ncbi:retrovirus-related pol polyprotein from transposon TNT 1-94 [Tanacetum coccineum]|uniref:Retrovirus-related pol polyprotein from transposon TNT 1-94 n=1 Tax=Tanacetum coccineum TaxID=301880 RepID=A0ABQ5HVE9_9ASTR
MQMTLIMMTQHAKVFSHANYLFKVSNSFAEYVIESQQAAIQNSNSSAQQDALILSVIDQLKPQVVNCTKINMDNKSVNDTLTVELERYKEQAKVLKEGQNIDLKKNESLMQTVTLLKNDFKKEESRNIDREITLEKKIKQLDNIVFKRDQSAQTVHMLTKPQFFYNHTTKQSLGFQNPFYLKKVQQLEPKLYDGNVIKNTSAIVILDSEENLMLAKESRSKMILKQKDPMMLEKKVNTTPVDYVNSMNSSNPTPSSRPTKVEVPKELLKVSMVNTGLKKLKHHLAGFDVVVKERTMATAITECSDNSVSNQSAPSFDQLFELNELKAQSQEKDTVIKKLKERIKSLSGKMNEDKIKKDLEEIETINIELDHRVSKLIAENKHLKQTYKQLYDSIKPARIRSKEQCDDLINQVNLKSMEISNLNASLQEKVLEITALKDDLRKLKGKALVDNVVTKHTIDPEMLKIDVEPITPKLLNKKTAHSAYIKHTQEEAIVLRDLVKHVKSKYPLDHSLESACRYAKLIQELLTHISKTCPSVNNTDGKLVVVTPKNKDKRVRFTEPVTSSGNTITKTASTLNLVSNKPMLSSTGVKPSTSASGSQPLDKTKKYKIRQTPSSTQKNKVEAYPRKVKSSLKNKETGKPTALENETPKPVVTLVYSRKPRKSKTNVLVSKSKVVQIVLWYLDSGCSKHMTRDRSQLTNFVNKFVGTLNFGNDYVDHLCSTCAMGKSKKKPHKPKSKDTNQEKLYLLHMDLYGPMRVASVNGKKYTIVIADDYSRFTRVKCLRSKDEAPDFIIKLLKMIQKVGISYETFVARSPQQNGVVERRNRTLIKVAHTMLIYAKAPLFLWVEAVATACYTQNRSIIRLRYGKTPYELLHDKLSDLSFFHVFGALCYPTNDSENLDESSKHNSFEPALHEMTHATISSGLVPNSPPSTPFVPPSRTDWGLLFQTPFDELLNPPSSVNHPTPIVIALIIEAVAPKPAASIGSPSSTIVDQDAPSANIGHMNNDPFFGIPIPENDYESSSSNVIPTVVHTAAPNSEHVNKWTKDHPLGNIIIEPKTYKDAFTQSCWIEAMQEELNEFKRLEVWELIPCPDKVMVITLKWIYKEFSKGTVDPTLFIRRKGKDILLVQIYVDDIIFASTTPELCDQFSKITCSKFKMSMMGKISFFLGLQISQSSRGIFLSQSKYALESLKKYGMESSDPVDTPMVEKSKMDEDPQGKAVDPTHYRGMLGTLMYITASRPYLTYVVCMCVRYQAKPTEKHLHAVKRIFKYLRGTINRGLWYPKDSSIALTVYADADHAGCQDTRRSTPGCMQLLGDRLLTAYDLGFNKILMYCDDKSAIALCCKNVQQSLSKHIDIRFHFIKEQVENGVVELYFVNTEYQLADIFTKALGRKRIKFLINKLGMRSFTPETLKQLADEAEE